MFAFLTKTHEDEKTVSYTCETTISRGTEITESGKKREEGHTISGHCLYNKITKECHFENNTDPYFITTSPERVMIFEKLQEIARSGEKFPQTISIRNK
ncbi:MAG: hypothetical protein WC707_05675 [Candidatus Babeliaceae bacterium]|jgi:hypothetical protein